MDRIWIYGLVMCCLTGILIGCGSDEEIGQFEEDIMSFETYQDSFIRGCETGSNACVRIEMNYPIPDQGPAPAAEGIRRAINWFISSYLSGTIDYGAIYTDIKPAIEEYFNRYYRPNSRKAYEYYNRISGEILFENSEIITLQMTMESYTGGVHPVELTNIFAIDVETGAWHYNLKPYITDMDELKAIAKRYFRQERTIPDKKSLQDAGFHFRGGFKLPKSIGFTPRGLLLHYNVYEVAPYSKGETRFTIPYEEIEELVKMNKIRSME